MTVDTTYMDRTFLSLGHGFQFSSDPPRDIASVRYLQSADPWEVMASALARLQQGDFDAVDVLPGVMRRFNDALIWNGCVQMLGFACPWSKLRPFVQDLVEDRRSPAIQIFVPEILESSTALWSIELLLGLHDVAFDEGRGAVIQGALSRLIEKEAAEIDEGPQRHEMLDPEYPPDLAGTIVAYDREGFRELVRARKTELIRQVGSENVPVAEGEVLDVFTVAAKLHRRITQDLGMSGRIEFERMLFEANTGTDCRSFFSRDFQLQNLQAAAVVEEFLDIAPRPPLEPGRRYFFGHPVPD